MLYGKISVSEMNGGREYETITWSGDACGRSKFTASMGITGMADTSGAGENGSQLDGMVCMDGSVISAEDGRLHLNRRVEGGMTEVVVNLSEDTKILDAVNGFPVSVENLDDGEAVRVYTGPAMTLSLPPITNGILVLADAPQTPASLSMQWWNP